MTIQSGSRNARALTLLAATLALLVQALVVQLHWHAPAISPHQSLGTAARSVIQTSGTDHESSSESCVICLEQAMAGHYTLPPLITFAGDRPRGPDPLAPQGLDAFIARQASHSWHSRDPPRFSV
jgi:hypothetical protein